MLKKVDENNPYSLDEEVVVQPEPAKQKRSRKSALSFFRAVGQGLFMVLMIVGAVVAMNRIIDSKPPTKSRPSFKSAYTVDLFTAEKASNRPEFVSYGQVVAARTVDLRSLVSGEIVAINPKLRAGETINKGEVLVEIDRFNYEGALSEANANLLEAQSRITENEARIALEKSKTVRLQEQLDLSNADLKRIERLKQRKQATQQAVETRKLGVIQRQQAVAVSRDTIKVEQARLEQLRASVQRLEWKIQQAQRNLDSTKLVAPFTAIVRTANAEAGRLVSANDVVVSLYEQGTLETRFTLTDEQYGRLQTADEGLIGREVTVDWTVGGKSYSWPGTIDRLGADITSSRGGVEVFAVVGDATNEVALRPGAFAEVTVPDVTFKDSFKLPDTALYGTDTVYVAVDGKLEKREVEVAAFVGETVLISSGLQEGDRVLTTRITEVSAGLSVQTEAEANAPKPEGQSRKGAPTGRPTQEEMTEILKANEIDLAAFRALSRKEKRDLIAAHRASQGS